MATRMLQRRGTAAEWAALNPVLSNGEIGFETDTKIIRVGDGVTAWNDLTLPYVMSGGGIMTGPLSMVEPTQNAHGVRKVDLDSAVQNLSNSLAALFAGAQTQTISTNGTTTSSGYTPTLSGTDPGPSVTVEVPESGRVLILSSCRIIAGPSFAQTIWGSSGANNITASSDSRAALRHDQDFGIWFGTHDLPEGLTPGETTFFQQYRAGANTTGQFSSRRLTVIPLP